ncbi:MAG: hypothetical protein JKY19_06590 [Alcanivoracaceae bacterium]|nr:hypothetical protein [Alcanivoracaceae bacterium]
MTTRVDILKEKIKTINFPAHCPVCGIENPDSTINMRTYISVNQPFKEKIGEHWKLDIPVCSRQKNIRVAGIISGLLFLIMLTLAIAVLFAIWIFIGL